MEIFQDIATYLVLAAVSIFVFLIFIETLLRLSEAVREVFSPPVKRSDFVHETYLPYMRRYEDWSAPMFSYHPVGLRFFNTDSPIRGHVINNEQGFRAPEFCDVAESRLRVAVLGGSTAWGCGASSNDATIAGVLEQELLAFAKAQGFDGVQSFSLAQIGNLVTQDLLNLVVYGPLIRPHIVVSLIGWNEMLSSCEFDLQELERLGAFPLGELNGWIPPQVTGRRTARFFEDGRILLRERLALARRFLTAPSSGYPASAYSPERIRELRPVASRMTAEHLKTIQTMGTAFGFTAFSFFQPHIYRKRSLTEQENRIIELYEVHRPVNGGREVGDLLRSGGLYSELVHQAGHLGVDHVYDLEDFFVDAQADIYYTLVHMNDYGYEVVASHICRVVQDNAKICNPCLSVA